MSTTRGRWPGGWLGGWLGGGPLLPSTPPPPPLAVSCPNSILVHTAACACRHHTTQPCSPAALLPPRTCSKRRAPCCTAAPASLCTGPTPQPLNPPTLQPSNPMQPTQQTHAVTATHGPAATSPATTLPQGTTPVPAVSSGQQHYMTSLLHAPVFVPPAGVGGSGGNTNGGVPLPLAFNPHDPPFCGWAAGAGGGGGDMPAVGGWGGKWHVPPPQVWQLPAPLCGELVVAPDAGWQRLWVLTTEGGGGATVQSLGQFETPAKAAAGAAWWMATLQRVARSGYRRPHGGTHDAALARLWRGPTEFPPTTAPLEKPAVPTSSATPAAHVTPAAASSVLGGEARGGRRGHRAGRKHRKARQAATPLMPKAPARILSRSPSFSPPPSQ